MTQQEKTFIAFMEGVCKKFNCIEAVAPLSEGFKAYCETAEMAKAFGKATYGKSDKNPTVKAARDSYKKDLKNYGKDKDAKERAEAFNRGKEEQWVEEKQKEHKKACSGKACTEASYGFDTVIKDNEDGDEINSKFDPVLFPMDKTKFAHELGEWRRDGYNPKFDEPMTWSNGRKTITATPRRSEFDRDSRNTVWSGHIPSAIQSVVNNAIEDNNWNMGISKDKTAYVLNDDDQATVDAVTAFLKPLRFSVEEQFGETMGRGLTSAGTHIESGDTYSYYVFTYAGHERPASGKACTEASDAAIRALKPNTTLIRRIGNKNYTQNSDGRWNLSPVTAKSVASLVVQHANPDNNETVTDDEYAVVGILDSNSPCYDSVLADELTEKFRNRKPGMTIQDCYDYTVETVGKSHPEAVEAGRQLVQRYNDELIASMQDVLGI